MSDALKNSAPKESLEWLNRGLADLGETSSPELAELHIKLGAIYGRLGNFDDALSALEKLLYAIKYSFRLLG
jgi:tetratricopeptide (TPR) repeat protein